MISLLSSGIPFTEKGNIIYMYEEGHRRFVLHSMNRSQKLDDSMFNDAEADHVNRNLKKMSRLLAYEHKEGTPSSMTTIVYIAIILTFVGLITLLVLSDDFLNVITSDFLLIGIVSGLILLSTLIVGLASYRYYSHALAFLTNASAQIEPMVANLNAEAKFGLQWDLGELALWLAVRRPDLAFANEFPDDADDEPEEDYHDEHDDHGHGHGHKAHH
jgi:hypothetical protein